VKELLALSWLRANSKAGMSAFGTRRTSKSCCRMSAFGG